MLKSQGVPMSETMLRFLTLLAFLWLLPVAAWAGTAIPLTVTLSESVVVTGSPRLAVDVGGITRYATYTSGSGTSALTFTYAMQSGDVDLDGISVSSPIQLNGGTIKDLSGNNLASLAFTPPNTAGIIVNGAVPSGYAVAFTSRSVSRSNQVGLSFQLTGAKANRTYHYTISSSGGGATLTGSGTTTGLTQTISAIDVSGLMDGKLTLSLTLTDSLGGMGAAVTDVVPKALLDSNLIGYWTFDTADSSGTTIYDRSTNGNNGIMVNGPSLVTGKVGDAVSFDGTSNRYVSMGDPASGLFDFGVGQDFSYAFWLKRNASVISQFIITKGAQGTANVGYSFVMGGGVTPMAELSKTGEASRLLITGASVNDTNWHHFVVVNNRSGNGLVYKDGVLTATGSISAYNVDLSTSAPFVVGVNSSSTPNGLVDDVRLYNRALSASDVVTLYNAEQ